MATHIFSFSSKKGFRVSSDRKTIDEVDFENLGRGAIGSVFIRKSLFRTGTVTLGGNKDFGNLADDLLTKHGLSGDVHRTNWRRGFSFNDGVGDNTNGVSLAAAAFPENEIRDLRLPKRFTFIPAEIAIAALVGKVTTESVLVSWLHKSEVVSFLVRGGDIAHHVSTPAGPSALTVAQGSVSAALRLDSNVARVSFCIEDDASDHRLEAKILRLFNDDQRVLKYPEIFGLIFADKKSWNLIPDGIFTSRITSFRNPLVAAVLAAGVGICVLSGYLYQNAEAKRVLISRASADLRVKWDAIRNELPDEKSILAWNASKAEFGAIQFFAWVSQNTPRGARITRMNVKPAEQKQATQGSAQIIGKTAQTSSGAPTDEPRPTFTVVFQVANKAQAKEIVRLIDSKKRVVSEFGSSTLKVTGEL